MIHECRPELLLPLAELSTAGILVFSAGIRKAIIKRQHSMCDRCGDKARLQCHHRIPQSKDGLDDIDNGIGLCETCHKDVDREALRGGIIYPQRHWKDGYYPEGKDDERITNSPPTQ